MEPQPADVPAAARADDKDSLQKLSIAARGLSGQVALWLPQRTLTMLSMCAGAFAIGAAQNLMAPNLTRIAGDLELSVEQRDVILGGWMSSAFFLVGAPMSILAGVLADKLNRTRQLVLVLLAGAVVIGLNALAFSVWHLLLLRVCLGCLHGVLNPILFSVVGDLYPAEQRSSMAALVGLAVGGGTAVGQLCAGMMSRHGWRLPYLAVAVLCGVGAAAVATFATEPTRGLADALPVRDTDGAHAHAPASPGASIALPTLRLADMSALLDDAWSSMRVQFRRIINIRTNQLIFLQALYGTVPWSVITVFLNDYLAQEIGLSVPRATFLVLLFGLGAAAGGIIGGLLGARLYRWSPHYVPLFFGVTQAMAALPMILLIAMPPLTSTEASRDMTTTYALAVVSGLVAAGTGPNLKAMLMNVNLPDTRASVFTFQYVFDSFAKGVAPYMIGVLVAHTGRRARIFHMAMYGWMCSGLLIIATAASIGRDEAEARRKARGGEPELQEEEESKLR